MTNPLTDGMNDLQAGLGPAETRKLIARRGEQLLLRLFRETFGSARTVELYDHLLPQLAQAQETSSIPCLIALCGVKHAELGKKLNLLQEYFGAENFYQTLRHDRQMLPQELIQEALGDIMPMLSTVSLLALGKVPADNFNEHVQKITQAKARAQLQELVARYTAALVQEQFKTLTYWALGTKADQLISSAGVVQGELEGYKAVLARATAKPTTT